MQRSLMSALAVVAIMSAGSAYAEGGKPAEDFAGCAIWPVAVTETAAADGEAAAREAEARERIGSMIDRALSRTAPGEARPKMASSPLPRRDVQPGS